MQEKVGRYSIVRPLGHGAMGSVYLATDPVLNRQVAIKMVDFSIGEGAEREFLRERLLRDAKAAALLSHPNVVGVYDVIETDNTAYVVMEYVPGESLATYLERIPVPGNDLTLGILRQIASALDYTHSQGIIHRDIKPGNVMHEPNGVVKILDFGIARMSDGRTSTPTGVVMGTMEYMSPEQLKGETPDGRSDQFSVAAVAYRMLTGSTLFGPHTMATLAYKVVNEMPPPATSRNALLPPAADRVLATALAKLPADRFSSCTEFVETLNQAFIDRPATSSTSGLPLPPARRRASIVWLAAAACVAVLAGGLVLWKPWSQSGNAPKPGSAMQPREDPAQSPFTSTVPTTKRTRSPRPEEPRPADTSHGVRLYDQGQEQVNRGDFAQAIQSFTAALAVNPKLEKAYFSRGRAHELAGQNDAAIQDYSQAIQLNPDDALSYTGRGVCFVRAHQDQPALADFNRALTRNPELAPALNGRGGIFLRRKDYAQAIRDFDAALRINPQFVQAYENRALAKRSLADIGGSTGDSRKAPELKGLTEGDRGFVVYDNMFYKGKPNTAQEGLVPANMLYERSIWPDGNNSVLPDRRAYEEVVRVHDLTPGPFVIDIESLPVRGPDQVAHRNMETLATLADWTHHAARNQVVGFYGLHTLSQVPPANLNDARELARHVDAFFQPMYTFDDDREAWRMKAEATVAETRKLDPKKPVYFFLWPQYHDHTPKQFRYIDASYWRFELETAYRQSDGVMLWSPSRYEWNDATGWWSSTVNFIRERPIGRKPRGEKGR